MEKFNGQAIVKYDGTNGNAAVGVKVTVKNQAGTLATLYSTNDTGGATLSNPVTSDSDGRYSFYAPNGNYTLSFDSGDPDLVVSMLDAFSSINCSSIDDAVASTSSTSSGVFYSVGDIVTILDTNSTWVVESGLSDNGMDIRQITAQPSLYLKLKVSQRSNAVSYGNISESGEDILERIQSNSYSIYLPAGEYDSDDIDVVDISEKVVIHGDTPSYDPSSGEKKGTWINGVLSVTSGAVALFDIGIDSSSVTSNEGVIIADQTTPPEDVFVDRVIVIAKAASNHCFLIENAKRVHVGTVTMYGGVQGLAIKAEEFYIGNVFAYDQTTWGCTVRYSPTAICHNGYVGNVYCGTIDNSTGGGVICMNDETDAALKNITFDNINIENGGAGFYITNTGNTTPAENININNITIDGVSGYAVQTFGIVKGLKVNKANLKDCGGSFYTNGALSTDFELRNVTVENVTSPALLEGSDHIASGWKKTGSSGSSYFIQNASVDLQVFNMDLTNTAVANISGGNVVGPSQGSVAITGNGNLPAMTLEPSKIIKNHFLGVIQNEVNTLFTLDSTGTLVNIINMLVVVQSQAGIHSRYVSICRDTIDYLNSSASASTVFEIQKTGDDIEIKYLFVTTGDVSVNVVADILQ